MDPGLKGSVDPTINSERAVVDAVSCELATVDIGLEHGADAVFVAGDAGAVEKLKQRDSVFTGQTS